MAAAVVDGRRTSLTDIAATSHVVLLPDGDKTGRLVVVNIVFDTFTGTVTWPADWNVIDDVDDGSGRSRELVGWHEVDGTEGFDGTGDSITVTTSATDEAAHNGLLISGHGGLVEGLATVGNSVNANPPSLSPTGGSKDYLWLVFSGSRNGADYTAYPTNYVNGQYVIGTSGSNASAASAERTLTAATEDPGVFTQDVARPWSVFTVAVHPAGGVVTGRNVTLDFATNTATTEAAV